MRKILFCGVLLLAFFSYRSEASFFVNPVATGQWSGGSARSTTVTISSSFSSGRVLLAVFQERTSGSPDHVESVTSPHLTWTQRSQSQGTVSQFGGAGSCVGNLELWYADFNSTLSSENVVVTGSAPGDAAVVAAAVMYANSPTWDPNGSLPVHTFDNTGGIPPSVVIPATTNASNAVLGITGYCNQSPVNAGSGFTMLRGFRGTSPATNWLVVAMEYKDVATPQLGLSIPFSGSISSGFFALGDATTMSPLPYPTQQPSDCVIPTKQFTATTYSPSVTTRDATISTNGPEGLVVMFSSLIAETGFPVSPGAAPMITGITGAGLTWNFRKRVNGSAPLCWGIGRTQTCWLGMEEWWAVAPSALMDLPITVSANSGLAFAQLELFSVTSSNPNSPWDTNGSLTASQFVFNGNAGPTVREYVPHVSTDSSNTLALFSCMNWAGVSTGGTICPPWSLVSSTVIFNGQSSPFIGFGIDVGIYQHRYHVPLADVTLTALDSPGPAPSADFDTWITMADALQCTATQAVIGGARPNIWISVTD